MFFSSLFLAASLLQRITAHPSNKPASGTFDHALQKRAGQVITSGANGLGDGQIHSRLEISDLANRPDEWSLYIRTMAKWQDAAQSDTTSYFGISSIHGVPRTSWDGVEPCDTCGSADGYCTHNSVLFPAWHRAYMALYEQELLKVAADVASSFSGDFGSRMQAAAHVLRIPYWDWAANPDNRGDVLPPAISGQQVTIAGPNGQETLSNPLFEYKFTSSSGMYYSPFTVWDTTLRYPTSDAKDATSQEQQATTAFNQLRENIQDQVYALLANCDNYLHFATDDSSSPAGKCANSLEGIHNTIHTTCGGAGSSSVSGGHMTYLPLASFDPIFWMHHANVDRLFALWQTVHPQTYGASQTAPHATWTIASGSTQDANSPLKPFRKDANNFWTTNDVKDWSNTFKYTYPEFVASDGSQDAIINYINSLYGSNADLTASAVSSDVEKSSSLNQTSPSAEPTTSIAARAQQPTPYPSSSASTSTSSASDGGFGIGVGIGPISMSLSIPFGSGPYASAATSAPSNTYPSVSSAWNGTATHNYPAPTGTGSTVVDPRFIAPNGSTYEYQCNVQTPRYAFNGSYTVYVFDGQPSTNDSSAWLGDDNCIGIMGVFAGGDMSGDDILSSGSVPITRHLQKQCKAGKLEDMSEANVTPYMAKNLNWKIIYAGEEVHPNALSGFKSSFWSGSSTQAGNGLLPSWSDFVPNIDVTKGKAGGVQQLAEAIGNEIGNGLGALTSAIGGILPGATGYGSTSGSWPAELSPAESTPAVTQSYGSPAVTSAAPSYPASSPQEGEETVTVYVTEYETVCSCQSAPTSAPAAPTY
ncbi:hypothetical protein AC579_2638 [Pseudocercospora musae]|uniref:tyrosinase n=1 Tax=Pseudocercospora musae TaxID=113226 RepID=A0A139IGI5_9PEZI|nr:hypothetical protein AC579_2638 [Pseudocercospora musae]